MENNTNTEIDLLELTIKSIKYIKRKKALLLSSLLIGLGLGYAITLINPQKYTPTYTKDFSLVYANSIAPEEVLYKIIEGIEIQLKDKKNQGPLLSSELHLSLEEVNKIQGIKSFGVTTNQLLTIANVTIEVSDKNIIDSVINSIGLYVNSTYYIKEKIKIISEPKLKLLSMINTQLRALDSAQYNNRLSPSNPSPMMSAYIDHTYYIELYDIKNEIESELAIIESDSKIAANYSSPQLNSNKAKKYLTIMGFGLLIVFIVATIDLLRHFLTKIKILLKD